MNANGPAVEGVKVGGPVHRYESRYFRRKIVPAKDKVVSVAGFVQSRSHGFGR
jgi:hypothetical protein